MRMVDACSTLDAVEQAGHPGLSAGGAPNEEIARAVEGAKPHPQPGEGVRPTLFTVHDAHCVADDQADVPKCRHRLGESATGCDDVFQKAHDVPPVERAFDPIRCAVFLGLTTHDDERQLGRHGRRSRQGNGPESRSGEPDRVRFDLPRNAGESLAERSKKIRTRLEPVLVQIPGRAFARPKQEVTLEERVLDEETTEVVGHAGVAWAAICNRRSSSGDPASRVTDEPSA